MEGWYSGCAGSEVLIVYGIRTLGTSSWVPFKGSLAFQRKIFENFHDADLLTRVIVFFNRAEAIYSQIGMAGEVDQFSFVNATLLASVVLIVWFVVSRLFSRGHFVHGFHEKYVLLTGCDSGFGKVTALELDRLGFNVFATCLTKEGQEELNAVCSERLKTIHLDVTDSQEIRDALSFVMQNLPANTGKDRIQLSPYLLSLFLMNENIFVMFSKRRMVQEICRRSDCFCVFGKRCR